MSKGSGTTRGDRRRNARRERLREMLPRDGAVIGIDLAEDKQAIAVVDHDVRVLGPGGRCGCRRSGWVRRWTGRWGRRGRRGSRR